MNSQRDVSQPWTATQATQPLLTKQHSSLRGIASYGGRRFSCDALSGTDMLGCWWGERMLRSIVQQPPPPRIPVESPRSLTFDAALAEFDRRRAA